MIRSLFISILLTTLLTTTLWGGGYFNSIKAKCKKKNCHPSVGMLSQKEQRGVSFCTGFLIDHDIVATNSHCVGMQGRDHVEQPDEGAMFFHLPKTGKYPAERIGVSRIMLSYKIQKHPAMTRRDIAFLKLVYKTKRPVLKMNNSGFQKGERVSVWDIDVRRRGGVGYLEQKRCKVIYHSMLSLLGFAPDSPHVTLADCSFKGGNSGAPIIDKRGVVKGLLFGRMALEKTSRQFRHMMKKSGLKGIKLGMGINLACILSENEGLPVNCYQSFSPERFRVFLSGIKLGLTKRLKTIKKWIKEYGTVFGGIKWRRGIYTAFYDYDKKRFDFNRKGNFLFYSIEPECVVNPDQISNGFRKIEGWRRGLMGKSLRGIPVPIYPLQFRFNQYFQINRLYPAKYPKKVYANLMIQEDNFYTMIKDGGIYPISLIFSTKRGRLLTDPQIYYLKKCK